MKTILFTMILAYAIGFSAFAADVTTVKGTKAIINLSGTDAQVGQQFYVLSAEGKKVGIIEIKKVQNGRALAEILKGRADVGGSLTPKAAATGSSQGSSTQTAEEHSQNQQESSEETSVSKKSRKKLSGGFLAGYGMHTFAMDIGSASPRDAGSLTGSSISAKAFADYDLTQTLTIRAASGLETFSTKGTIAHNYCDNGASASCSVTFNYLALEGSGHYNYMTGKTRAWFGLGYSFLFQMSASNNIPNLQTSSTNNMLLVSTGADFALAKGRFIPVVVEYGLFPGSSDVKASSLFLRVGYGFPF